MKNTIAVGVLICLASLAGAARADTVYDSTGDWVDSQWGGYPASVNIADSFSISSAETITSVSLILMDRFVDTLSDSDTVSIEIVGDNDTTPDLTNVLGVVASDWALTAVDPTEDTFSTDISLTSAGRYWLYVTADPDSSAGWLIATTNTGTGVSGEYNFNMDAGFPWSNDTDQNPFAAEISTGSGASTPEPATFVLGAVSLLGLAIRRKLA